MSEQVHIRVQEGRRDDWREHAEDEYPEKYGNLSALIRHAVERQIERDSGEGGGETIQKGETPEPNGRIDELLESVRAMRNDMTDLSDNVDSAVDAVHAQTGIDPDLPPRVFEALPDGEDSAQTAERIAERMGEKPAAVRFALENLRKNTRTVQKVKPLDPQAEQDDVEAGYERGVQQEPRWYVEG